MNWTRIKSSETYNAYKQYTVFSSIHFLSSCWWSRILEKFLFGAHFIYICVLNIQFRKQYKGKEKKKMDFCHIFSRKRNNHKLASIHSFGVYLKCYTIATKFVSFFEFLMIDSKVFREFHCFFCWWQELSSFVIILTLIWCQQVLSYYIQCC